MMTGQEDTSSNFGDEVLEESTEEEISGESEEESSGASEEESPGESEEASSETSEEETSGESVITLEFQEIPITSDLNDLGLIGVSCLVIIFIIGLSFVLDRSH